VTLDGVMQPLDWTAPFAHPEHGAYSRTSADDGPGEEGFIDRINSLPKYVASMTLQAPLAWNNSHIVEGDVADAVADLKRQPGQSILMYGGGPVARALLQRDLVDELRLWVYPVIAGSGERIFNSAVEPTYFQHVDTTPFSSGVVVQTYQPKRETPAPH
jgi:dihydrofolate reductase